MHCTPHPHLKAVMDFAADFAARMLGSGASTLRVMRCTRRVVDTLGVELEMCTTQRHFTITCRDPHTTSCCTRVVAVPELPISFECTSALSTLSWEAHDECLTLPEMRRRFDAIVRRNSWAPWQKLVLISVANACFCRLFDGDVVAMAFVMVATLVGFFMKMQLSGRRVNHYIVTAGSAFVASLIASISLAVPCTAQIAIATSPLFLVPGVPLINGIIDIVEGHIQVGLSRLISAMLVVLCIAIGLSATLMIVKGSLI